MYHDDGAKWLNNFLYTFIYISLRKRSRVSLTASIRGSSACNNAPRRWYVEQTNLKRSSVEIMNHNERWSGKSSGIRRSVLLMYGRPASKRDEWDKLFFNGDETALCNKLIINKFHGKNVWFISDRKFFSLTVTNFNFLNKLN
jgi:hypothetical protein